MKLIVPDNYKLIVHVYQYRNETPTFKRVAFGQQANRITEFLRYDIKGFIPGGAVVSRIITDCEMHVLRLLRHVREEVGGIKLTSSNLEVWFDNPDNSDMVMCRVTDDGDFLDQVPGGFFTQRAAELF